MNPLVEAKLRAFLDGKLPFSPPPLDAAIAVEVLGPSGAPETPHRRLLELANGAYLYGGALHLFGACDAPAWHSLRAWNDMDNWRSAYGHLSDGLTFFAEDAFGDQFAYSGRGGEIVHFAAELGRAAPIAPDFLAWVDALLDGAESLLPVELVRAQAAAGRAFAPGKHYFAWPPLFSVEARDGVEIGHVDAVEAMRVRGQLARQASALPPGTQIRVDVEDE